MKVYVSGSKQMTAQSRNDVAVLAAQQIGELNDYYGSNFDRIVQIIVTGRQQEFAAAAGTGAPDWAMAVASPRRVVIGPLAEVDSRQFASTLKHELSHVVLDDMFVAHPENLPQWLNEGLAVMVSGEWDMPEAWTSSKTELYTALRNGDFIDFDELTGSFPSASWKARLAYAQSFHFTDYLVQKFGREKIDALLKKLAAGEEFDSAFKSATGKDFDDVEEYWKAKLHGQSGPALLLLSLWNIDNLIWFVMALLVVLGFARYLWRRKRKKMSDDDDDYDEDEDDYVDEWEYWDEESMGHKPWRPGRDKD